MKRKCDGLLTGYGLILSFRAYQHRMDDFISSLRMSPYGSVRKLTILISRNSAAAGLARRGVIPALESGGQGRAGTEAIFIA
jgi:hypothetical protein